MWPEGATAHMQTSLPLSVLAHTLDKAPSLQKGPKQLSMLKLPNARFCQALSAILKAPHLTRERVVHGLVHNHKLHSSRRARVQLTMQ